MNRWSLSASSTRPHTLASGTRQQRYFCGIVVITAYFDVHQKTQYHAGAFTFNPLLVLLVFIIMLSGAIYHNKKNNPSLDDMLLATGEGDESGDDDGKKKKKLEFSASVKAVHLTEVVLCMHALLLQPTVLSCSRFPTVVTLFSTH